MKGDKKDKTLVERSLPILKAIYEHESSKLDGPGSYSRDIQDVLWSINDLMASGVVPEGDRDKVELMLRELSEQNQVKAFPNPDGETRYVTRVAETVRLLGHNYEYWHQGRPGIGAVRWLVESKTVPRRDIDVNTFKEGLCAAIREGLGSGELTDRLVGATDISVDAVAGTLSGRPADAKFSQFQLDATVEMIMAQYKGDHSTKCQIMTAGVGSGKTIAFTLALLISTVENHLDDDGEERCHLLLYPRTALAKDQYGTLSKMVSNLGIPTLTGAKGVHLEHVSYYKANGTSSSKGVAAIYGSNSPPPAIIITTLETLNRRMQRPEFARKMSHHLSRVVVDEVHLVEGMTGSNIVQVLSRLQGICKGRQLLWTAASATIADPDHHCSRVFGVNRASVAVIAPDSNALEEVGLVHHVFLRPSGNTSVLGNLVNSTSILIHNRREDLGSHGGDGEGDKAIGFADNLDMLGRWNADLRENERTEVQSGMNARRHPMRSDPSSWNPRQREIPYALRFNNPLQRRIEAEGGKEEGKENAYEPVLTDLRGKKVCERCRSGERTVLKKGCTKEEMMALGKLVYREDWKAKDNVKTFYIDSPIFQSGPQDVGTMDLCPFLRAGACFLFSTDDLLTEEISDNVWEWRSVARSHIYSSKTKPENDELGEDLGEIVYTGTKRDVYDIGGKAEIPIDIVLASPSLEVGVDLRKVTESIMFKAIRNVASYRQKAGRVGREVGSDVMNVSLMSTKPIDLHYYRQPRKLISRGHLDPIPLKEHNEAVIKSALYMAVWDELALHSALPEIIPTNISCPSEFYNRLYACKGHLENYRERVAEHLCNVSRGRYEPTDGVVQGAIEQVEREIELLLRSTSGVLLNPEMPTVADFIVNVVSKRGHMPNFSSSTYPDIFTKATGEYQSWRAGINPVKLGLSAEFMKLDTYHSSGWCNAEAVKDVKQSMDRRLDELGEGNDKAGQTNIRNARRLSRRAIADIIEGLEEMVEAGSDPMVWEFCRQFRNLHGPAGGKFHYLSYVLEDVKLFEQLREDMAYVRPKNLFTSPYVEQVKLTGHGIEETITMQEAIQSFVPGTWTYRLGKDAIKVAVGRLNHYSGKILSAENLIDSSDSRFIKIKDSVPGPPQLPGKSFALYSPSQLRVIKCAKYVQTNPSTLTVRDGDEDEYKDTFADDGDGEGRRGLTKIPKSFAQKWVHIEAGVGEAILCNDLEEQRMIIEDAGGELKGADARRVLKHPLQANHVDDVRWHDGMHVHEYVYSVSRAYASKGLDGVDMVFKNGIENVAIGHIYESEGISIELNPRTLDATVSEVRNSILSNEDLWAPTALKALTAALAAMELEDGGRVNPFLLRDLMGTLVASTLHGGVPIHAPDLTQRLSELLEAPEELRELARAYFTAKRNKQLGQEADEVLEEDIETLVEDMISLASQLRPCANDVLSNVDEWIKLTILNTFGVVALNSLMRLSGTRDSDVGYTIDIEGLRSGRYRVFIFDATPRGNGSSEVLRRYLHILNVQRHGRYERSRLLPSEDFFDILEQGLMQCPQFQTDMDALEKHSQEISGSVPVGMPELGYVTRDSDEVLRVSRKVWNVLGVKGRQDAWKLPLIASTQGGADLFTSNGLDTDDVVRATSVCWNGCPECVVNNDVLSGPMANNYLDKMILDQWFSLGASRTQEYLSAEVGDLLNPNTVDFGHHSKLYLDFRDRMLRSVSLPYSLGFDLDREGADLHPHVIIRNDDIHGVRCSEAGTRSVAVAIEAHGFKRIIWYSLLTSLYLDRMGMLPSEEKVIKLVFYDCRDIGFEDVGFSERMLDAIELQRKESGYPAEMQTLSDVLAWACKCGFEVTICIDEGQSKEAGVRSFLEAVRVKSAGRARLLVKRLTASSMHKKVLQTPVGTIDGSANLTASGSGSNEESITYIPRRVAEFEAVSRGIEDTIKKAISY